MKYISLDDLNTIYNAVVAQEKTFCKNFISLNPECRRERERERELVMNNCIMSYYQLYATIKNSDAWIEKGDLL